MTNIRRYLLPLALFALGGAACSEELAPFEDLAEMRILAIQVDDPDLLPEQETTLRSLVYAEPGATVSYAWDWCPFPSGASEEYACGVSQEELDEIVSATGGESPSLMLGNTADVPFKYPVAPEFLQAFCQALQSEDVPEGVTLIDCEDDFPITLRLVATTDTGYRVVAVRTTHLLYEDPDPVTDLNTNPGFTGLRVAKGEDVEAAVPFEDGFVMERDEKYTILVDVEEDQAQSYTIEGGEQRENLFVHWFYEGGEYKEETTGFIEGFLSFENLAENVFTTPDSSFTRDELELYMVMRDERGGIGWVQRTIRLE